MRVRLVPHWKAVHPIQKSRPPQRANRELNPDEEEKNREKVQDKRAVVGQRLNRRV